MADAPLAAVLAIDGGNSKTDVALIAPDGTVLAAERGPGASHEQHGVEQAMRILDGLVRSAAAQTRGQSGVIARHTSACLAGADLPEEEAQLTAALRLCRWSRTAIAVNDTFAVLRAGLSAEEAPGDGDEGDAAGRRWPGGADRPWGVAVTCGAGINCVAVAPDGRTTRYLAHGVLTGDWGGGEELGQQVMWHAMRAEDGRGPATALTQAAAAANSTEVRPSRSSSPSWPLCTAIATSVTDGRPKWAAAACARAVAGPRPSSARMACHITCWPSSSPPPQSPVRTPWAR